MTASKQGQHQMAQDPLAGDAGSTYAPLTPVPDARRAFRTGDAFALWFSLGIGLLVAQAGALVEPASCCLRSLA
jgi:NCS1 family nucleobase:cation symporter-1